MIGAEGGTRTLTTLRSTNFKSVGGGITWSYQTIRTSIYGPSGRQGIASSGYVSTRPATILAPSIIVKISQGSGLWADIILADMVVLVTADVETLVALNSAFDATYRLAQITIAIMKRAIAGGHHGRFGESLAFPA